MFTQKNVWHKLQKPAFESLVPEKFIPFTLCANIFFPNEYAYR